MPVQPTRPAPLLPPGTYIEEWMEDEEVTQRETAERLGISEKHLSRVVNGHCAISPDLAAKLEKVTTYPAEFWLTHQARFDARTTQIPVTLNDIETIKPLLPTKCITRLRKAGLVKSTWRNGEQLIRELFTHTKVANPSALKSSILGQRYSAAFRQSEAFKVKDGALWTWLEIVKTRAQETEPTAPFDENTLRAIIEDLKKISIKDPSVYVSETRELLMSAGVIFIAEPDIPGARISGASFQINEHPVIAITDKGKREDIFWFTLFHEIAHVLAGDFKELIVDTDNQPEKSISEQQADAWASEALLPQNATEELTSTGNRIDINGIANKHNVSPAIVVGRLHHLQIADHSWGQSVIRRFEILLD